MASASAASARPIRLEGGVVSPGGVGYDINCGVRLMRTNLTLDDVQPRLDALMDALFRADSRRRRQGRALSLRRQGTAAADGRRGASISQGRGWPPRATSSIPRPSGCLRGAEADDVSPRALERGGDQCGTLGSGNHFLEVQVVEEICDEAAARAMGLAKDQVCVMIHSGSRGLGYQVCDDALAAFRKVPAKYGIELPDRQLACAPVHSDEGQKYLGAMRAAANFAWANRQLLMWQAREAFAEVFEPPWESLQMNLVYDVAHNIAKLEEHTVDGQTKKLCVHRKGATRAFPAGHPELPDPYRAIGQPVIIPGDMGRASWVLVGQPGSMEQSFGTTCHGAGRVMSRTAAVQHAQGRRIDRELADQGVIARCRSWKGLAEEQPAAYKDVSLVVDVVHRAGLASKVARMRPIGVVKG